MKILCFIYLLRVFYDLLILFSFVRSYSLQALYLFEEPLPSRHIYNT